MKARLIHHKKRILSDGSIEEIVLWELPYTSKDYPYGIKYRCYFGLADGTCLVRYDNEKGKGDHKHLEKEEKSYVFIDITKLLEDFFTDVRKAKKSKS